MAHTSAKGPAHADGPRHRTTARARGRAARSTRPLWIAVVIVVVVALALGIALAARGGSKASSARSPARPALVAEVASVPQAVIDQVGAGTATAPKRVDAPALTKDGKPLMLYIGAEYCPYCAAERWAMVQALSRFGKFSNLSMTTSSSVDAFPNTNTFSFYGSTFKSPYVTFDPVELATNQLSSSGGYEKLETPTAEQQQLMATYDAPPYVAGSGGGIPFVDIGGSYLIHGATYDPRVLQGKSADQIASALSDPSTAVSQGVIGAANAITASLCTLTHDRPAATCSAPAVKALVRTVG